MYITYKFNNEEITPYTLKNSLYFCQVMHHKQLVQRGNFERSLLKMKRKIGDKLEEGKVKCSVYLFHDILGNSHYVTSESEQC